MGCILTTLLLKQQQQQQQPLEDFQVQTTGRIARNNVNEIHHRCECGDFVGKDVVVVVEGVMYSGDNKNNPLAVQ